MVNRMSVRTAVMDLGRHARGFAHDRRGTAATEFVFILPAIFALAFGCAELSHGITIQSKLTNTARSVSDIVSQFPSIPDAEMNNVLKAGEALLQPYATDTLKVRVSAVSIDAGGQATIVWSDAAGSGAQPRVPGTVTIPPSLAIPNTQLIWGEVEYDFKPIISPFGPVIKALWNFKYEEPKNQFFARPRESDKVCRPPKVPVPC
jgi:Flp pilus assembly protein TadG